MNSSMHRRLYALRCLNSGKRHYSVQSSPPIKWEKEDNAAVAPVPASREAAAQQKLQEVHSEEIKEIIKVMTHDASMTDRPLNVLVNEILGYITTKMEERASKVARWFGENGNVSYIKEMSTLPDEDLPVHRRRYLDKTQNVAATPTKSYIERQRAGNLFRMYRAKEDSGNYVRTDEQKFADVFRPTTLDGYGGVVETRILNAVSDFKPDGKPLEHLQEPEHVYLDTTSVMLNRILKRNGVLPRWLELNNEIKEERLLLERQLMEIRNMWLLEKHKNKLNGTEIAFESYSQYILVEPFLGSKVKHLNKLILDFNLVAPSMHLQKFSVTLQGVIEGLEEQVGQAQQAQAQTHETGSSQQHASFSA